MYENAAAQWAQINSTLLLAFAKRLDFIEVVNHVNDITELNHQKLAQ